MTAFLAALLLFLFPLAFSPGPGNLTFAAQGARFGFLATLPANAGYHLATLAVTFLIGMGLISAIEPGSALFRLIKAVGSLYVLWLAWRMAQAGKAASSSAHARAGFVDGVLLLALNPKAYVIILLMFTQFADQAPDDKVLKVAVITSVFTLNNLVAFSLWTLLGDILSRTFRTDAGARRLNIAFVLVLAAVAIWMLAK